MMDQSDRVSPGVRWVWEPNNFFARQLVEITRVRWSGEEVWVETRGILGPDCGRHWNTLSRFLESSVPESAYRKFW